MMFRRPVTHNMNTYPAPNAVVRQYPGNFTAPSATVFAPPLARGIRDTNGDTIYLLASTPTVHSNPRHAGATRYENQRLTTTIFF